MILNLTQHIATPDQLTAGVVDLNAPERAQLIALLTVDDLPGSFEEILERAEKIAMLATCNNLHGDDEDDPCFLEAMIGGIPCMMAPLERALLDVGITARYAFSKRESLETHHPDGGVRKTIVFRHAGFVPLPKGR